jgi:hypothetical protein
VKIQRDCDFLRRTSLGASDRIPYRHGWMMAIVYALVLEPKLPGHPFFKGVAYGTAIWFLNAFLVLPLASEGIAGSRHSSTVGLIVFAVAHMTFFVVLSMLYGFIYDRSAR